MQVSVESKGTLLREMKVGVPGEEITKEVNVRLQKLSKTARINGFRPGKVPVRVVRQQYGDQVKNEVMGEVIQRSFGQALAEQDLKPAGLPTIQSTSEGDETFEYTATFEVMPTIELAPLDGITIERVTTTIDDADLEIMIETLRKQRATWNEVDRTAAEGDRVTIDFEGTINGEAFQGNSGTDMGVVIGDKRMIDGFESGLTGIKAGE